MPSPTLSQHVSSHARAELDCSSGAAARSLPWNVAPPAFDDVVGGVHRHVLGCADRAAVRRNC